MPLEDEPFSYRATKRGLVEVSYIGRVVTRLSGKAAERFLDRVEESDAAQAQLHMAKVTGHFKHGNERSTREHP